MFYISENALSSKLEKNFLYFRRELAKPEKQRMTAEWVCIPKISNK